ncbi:hypothetical protein C7I87_06265 [Mesorhizobium sp. SARCC-RB16n]|nr:hypothetical protein C7I87_06265 [Mesorhizobium sp. SARCC-RB16n]
MFVPWLRCRQGFDFIKAVRRGLTKLVEYILDHPQFIGFGEVRALGLRSPAPLTQKKHVSEVLLLG